MKLVASILLSMAVLSTTVIQTGVQVGQGAEQQGEAGLQWGTGTGPVPLCRSSAVTTPPSDFLPSPPPPPPSLLVQIAGAVVTVLSVTIYAAHRWLVSRHAAKATKGAAPSNSNGPPGSGQLPQGGQPKPEG